MKRAQLDEELSAYLDGESVHPEKIEHLIKTNVQVAQRYLELQQLSKQVQSLPEPEVRPEFLTRVMAHVREQEEERQPAGMFSMVHWSRWVAAGFMATLMVSVALGTWLRGENQVAPGTEQSASLVPVDVTQWVGLTDDDVVLERLQGFYGEEVAAYSALPEGEAFQMAAVATADWGHYEDYDAYGFSAQDDLFGVLDGLDGMDELEQAAFASLLQDYAN